MGKNNLKNKVLKLIRNFNAAYDIVAINKNEFSFSLLEAFKIYTISDLRINKNYLEKGGKAEFYNSDLEGASRLTERYLLSKSLYKLRKISSN